MCVLLLLFVYVCACVSAPFCHLVASETLNLHLDDKIQTLDVSMSKGASGVTKATGAEGVGGGGGGVGGCGGCQNVSDES